MGCFKQLVESSFLSNVYSELRMAQRRLQEESVMNEDPILLFDKKEKKQQYRDYMYELHFLETIMEEGDHDDHSLYCIQEDHILFVYSRKKKLIDESIRYGFYVHGDLPICRSRYKAASGTFFTALVDTRFVFPSSSPN
jgi:hypothetical protein